MIKRKEAKNLLYHVFLIANTLDAQVNEEPRLIISRLSNSKRTWMDYERVENQILDKEKTCLQ